MSTAAVPGTYGSDVHAVPRGRSVANAKEVFLPAPPTELKHGPLTRSYSVPDLVAADVRRATNPYKPQWASFYMANYPYRYWKDWSLTDAYGYNRYNPYLSPLQYGTLPPIRRYNFSYDYPFQCTKVQDNKAKCNSFYNYLYTPHGMYHPQVYHKHRKFGPYNSYLSDKYLPRYWLDNQVR